MTYTGRLEAYGRTDLTAVGGKAANLGEAIRAGLPVPPGFVVTTEAYHQFLTDQELAQPIADRLSGVDPDDSEALERASTDIRALFRTGSPAPAVRKAILAAYSRLGGGPVAVRSSATAEDLPSASFAGQQDTFLNVAGPDALLAAVRDCWASLWTARAIGYRARQGIDPAGIGLAVVVQRLIDADASGVMFTANPSNGRRTEVVISAAWGLGESVVGGTVNTDEFVLAKDDGRVLSSRVADKAVMTVRTDTGTAEVPVPPERRTAPVLDHPTLAELLRVADVAERHFGAPQDIEWARAGAQVFVVQARPITALPPPEADPPTDWPLPDPRRLYVRASIVEQLPDPLSPLFADLIDGSVARSLPKLINEFVPGTLRPGDVGLPTINGYAYYSYDRSAMLRLWRLLPKAWPMLRSEGPESGVARWRTYAHPRYRRVVQDWTGRALDELGSAELFAGVRELLDAGADYYTSVQTIIPVAASSEIVFTSFYSRLVQGDSDPPAATFLLGFDSEPIRAEKSLWDLSRWVAERPPLAAELLALAPDDVAQRLGGPLDDPLWAEFSEPWRAHLARFGHAVYNLDFVNPVAADDPGPLIDTLRFYLRGGGADPYARQAGLARRRERATEAVLARLDPWRASLFRRLLDWAQSTAPVREDALADVGLAWPELRRILAELGRRLVVRGVIEEPEQVFWLRADEVSAGLTASEQDRVSLVEAVEERQARCRGQRRVTPPQILPKGGWLGLMDRALPATTREQTGNVITGIGASAGRVSAPARVLSGPRDFGRLLPGEVLVASITTPAWTSLFARASGVVTDIGGPLSHSSIVAREYQIPAVLGTNVATRRIPDGEVITVDGDAGTVTLPAGPEEAPVPSARLKRSVPPAAVAALAAAAAGAVVVWRVARRTVR